MLELLSILIEVLSILKKFYIDTLPWTLAFACLWLAFLFAVRVLAAAMPYLFITLPIVAKSKWLLRGLLRHVEHDSGTKEDFTTAASELDSRIANLEHALEVLVFAHSRGGKSDPLRVLVARFMPSRLRRAALDNVRVHLGDLYFEYYQIAAGSSNEQQRAAGELVLRDPDALRSSRGRARRLIVQT